ncbi:hypothetical protein [Caenimonas aquaedulcis]|uniref:Transmembrane protein n=1 Tax=Caenimonas aquaedulcis TaxID=2793270 RepID=A0A931H1P4_9BURK|nr:hypothetical protein [Caenimonas aquaedulcis]MBG9386923.1 hypothetical protein [Caenimonas aquaedulcis]
MEKIRAFLRHTLTALLALVLIFEEWGWEQLAALLAHLAKLPLWGRVERWIQSLPPWGALATFFVPAAALLPIKLLALFFIGRGHAFMGLVVLLAAKVLGTAILARLFTLTQPTLMRLPWFARWYPRWKAWKDGVMDQVRRSPMWLTVGRWKALAKARWAELRRGMKP